MKGVVRFHGGGLVLDIGVESLFTCGQLLEFLFGLCR